MIVLDGADGGGQMLRTALALSCLTQAPFTLDNIRGSRPEPGLKAQHLAGIEAAAKLCDAEYSGTEIGSRSLTFRPKAIAGKTISIDIGTAGSVTLLLQSVIVPALFADGKTRLRISGGTDTAWAIPADYFNNVIVPHLQRFADVEFEISRRGFYPAGGGKIDVSVRPRHRLSQFPSVLDLLNHLRSLQLGFRVLDHRLVSIGGMSIASSGLEKAKVAERQARSAKVALLRLGVPVNIGVGYGESLSPGSVITLWAQLAKEGGDTDPLHPMILGADCLGKIGRRAETVGDRAAKELLAEIQAGHTADAHQGDNLIPLLGLAGGEIKTAITEHLRTNVSVVEKFLPVTFSIVGEKVSVH